MIFNVKLGCLQYKPCFRKNICFNEQNILFCNKANLRDLIAATGLIILLKLDSNHRFFSPCDLEIWWMTSKTIGHFFYTKSSYVHHSKSIGESRLELQSRNAQFGSKLTICLVWPWNLMEDLKNNRAPLLYYIKLCASIKIHRWMFYWVDMFVNVAFV